MKEARQSRKALEREMTKAMFIVRVTEMKADWMENRYGVNNIYSIIYKYRNIQKKYLIVTLHHGESQGLIFAL